MKVCNHIVAFGAFHYFDSEDGRYNLIDQTKLQEMEKRWGSRGLENLVIKWFKYCPKCGQEMKRNILNLSL